MKQAGIVYEILVLNKNHQSHQGIPWIAPEYCETFSHSDTSLITLKEYYKEHYAQKFFSGEKDITV